MTDITELALLVSKAKASVFTLEYISQFEPADIDSDDVDLRFEVDGRDNGTNVSIVDECGQAAKVIGALVVALEKAQQHIARQEQIILNQDESLSIRRGELEAAQQERENWRTSFDNERFRADKLASVLNDEIEQAANVRGQLLIAHKTLLNQQARIAELESRTVEVLTPEMRNALKAEGLADVLKDASEYAPLTAGQWETLTKNWHQTFIGLSDPAAGIKVETDSVDPDVSNRNQPGMIVAVHIDVGDFVKFRGRVYEVKETDFDDHDVTLWFVCGEVLKCAAGCPIEVVSAPVEDE